MTIPLTPHNRRTAQGIAYPVRLVRVGDDLAGFISTGDNGYVFGYVLTDPEKDTGYVDDGHQSVGFCLSPNQEQTMAAEVVQRWSGTPATALRGAGVGGWPLIALNGEPRLTCPACGQFHISISIRPGGYGTGPGRSWRMGDPGGREFAYCHDCGAASDAPRRTS